jgi:hypothetical protein
LLSNWFRSLNMVAEWAKHQVVDGCADLTRSSRRRVQVADLTKRAEEAERFGVLVHDFIPDLQLEDFTRAHDKVVQKVRPRKSLAIGPDVGMGH